MLEARVKLDTLQLGELVEGEKLKREEFVKNYQAESKETKALTKLRNELENTKRNLEVQILKKCAI